MQILIDIGVLSKQDYENWRFGRVDYLERVCKANLRKLSIIMREVRVYGQKSALKPSWTFYGRWGEKKKPVTKLRFSKSGNEGIERGYATHYISHQMIAKHHQMADAKKDKSNCEDVL